MKTTTTLETKLIAITDIAIRTPDFPWATKVCAAVAARNSAGYYYLREKQAKVFSHFVGANANVAAERANSILNLIKIEMRKEDTLHSQREFAKGAAAEIVRMFGPFDDAEALGVLQAAGIEPKQVLLRELEAEGEAAKAGAKFAKMAMEADHP